MEILEELWNTSKIDLLVMTDDSMSVNPQSIGNDDTLINAQSLMLENNTNTMLAVNKNALLCSTDLRLGCMR